MTSYQATAIIVLLAAPTGALFFALTVTLIGEYVVTPIRIWRQKRRSKRDEPMRKLRDDVYALDRDLNWLRRDFNNHVAGEVSPAPKKRGSK